MTRPPGPSQPLYAQIALLLQNRILAGAYLAGSPLPGENVLADDFDVSRGTIRQAIRQLVNNGYLVTRRGSGTYVADPLPIAPLPNNGPLFTGYRDELEFESRSTQEFQRTSRKIQATALLARQLDVPRGTPLVRFSAVRHRNGRPYGYAEDVLPVQIAAALDSSVLDASSTISDALSRGGTVVRENLQTIAPARLTKRIAGILKVAESVPALQISGVAYGNDRKPVNAYRLLMPEGYSIGIHLIQVGSPND